jgi:hypothetical protein
MRLSARASQIRLGRWRNPRRSSMGFGPENQVRTRLTAGGNRIRTVGSGGKGPTLRVSVSPPRKRWREVDSNHRSPAIGPRV